MLVLNDLYAVAVHSIASHDSIECQVGLSVSFAISIAVFGCLVCSQ